MKKRTIIFLVMLATTCLHAQNYYINFTAGGTASTLDSVLVYNLTQDTFLTLSSEDTLKLEGTANIFSNPAKENEIKIYPNPLYETGYIEFYSDVQEIAEISVYDVTGRIILQSNQEIQTGSNIFELSGFSKGYYQLSISSKTFKKNKGFVSLNAGNHYPQIRFKSYIYNEPKMKSSTKSAKNIFQMPYNAGDEMLYIGYAGLLSEDFVDIPTSSQTVNFIFSSSSCGGSFTDNRDGKSYTTVRIGLQCWMAENLKYLPSVVSSAIGSLSFSYYYVYGYAGSDVSLAEATTNYNIYGVLYNWQAAMAGSTSSSSNPSGVQGACPAGWHLPSDAEWTQLTDYLGGANVAGGKLKATAFWDSPNTDATNETGFTALPGGIRYTNGSFYYIGVTGRWWSSTEDDTDFPLMLFIDYNGGGAISGDYNKAMGISVRCVKD